VLVGIEIRIHRVLRDQGGQHALVGLGHIAHGEQGAAGTARDGRAHLGEVELQPRGGQLGLGRTHLGRGLGQRGPRVGLLARDRILGPSWRARWSCVCASPAAARARSSWAWALARAAR
jgi:hypothetical protein